MLASTAWLGRRYEQAGGFFNIPPFLSFSCFVIRCEEERFGINRTNLKLKKIYRQTFLRLESETLHLLWEGHRRRRTVTRGRRRILTLAALRLCYLLYRLEQLFHGGHDALVLWYFTLPIHFFSLPPEDSSNNLFQGLWNYSPYHVNKRKVMNYPYISRKWSKNLSWIVLKV